MAAPYIRCRLFELKGLRPITISNVLQVYQLEVFLIIRVFHLQISEKQPFRVFMVCDVRVTGWVCANLACPTSGEDMDSGHTPSGPAAFPMLPSTIFTSPAVKDMPPL